MELNGYKLWIFHHAMFDDTGGRASVIHIGFTNLNRHCIVGYGISRINVGDHGQTGATLVYLGQPLESRGIQREELSWLGYLPTGYHRFGQSDN